jgi:predicted nuclease with TOPRIM domain
MEKDHKQIKEMMLTLLEAYKAMSKENSEARMALADKDEQAGLVREHEERIEKMNDEVAQLRAFKRTQSSNVRSMLQRVDSISSKPPSRPSSQVRHATHIHT